MPKFTCPCGLAVWFSLRVREVPGSIPGKDLLYFTVHRGYSSIQLSHAILFTSQHYRSCRISPLTLRLSSFSSFWSSHAMVLIVSTWSCRSFDPRCLCIYLDTLLGDPSNRIPARTHPWRNRSQTEKELMNVVCWSIFQCVICGLLYAIDWVVIGFGFVVCNPLPAGWCLLSVLCVLFSCCLRLCVCVLPVGSFFVAER